MRTPLFHTPVVIAAAFLVVSGAHATVVILPINAAPDPISLANGISADGTTVVGRSMNSSGQNHAFRWSGALGFEPLGTVPPPSEAYAASATGAVVIGTTFPAAGGPQQAARWALGGTQILAPLPGDSAAEPFACSADGSIVVGRSMGPTGQQAVRWNAAGVAQRINPDHPGSGLYKAVGISANGQVIVGNTGLPDQSLFRWTLSDGYQTIPDDSTAALVARAVSGDGSCIVGSGLFPGSPQTAMRWTASGGYQSLGLLSSNAYATNIDGTVIGGENAGRAFIWTPTLGAVDLGNFLGAMGADVSRWQFWNLTGISADGLTLAGYGLLDNTTLSAFVITGIPSPGGAGVLLTAVFGLLGRTRRRG